MNGGSNLWGETWTCGKPAWFVEAIAGLAGTVNLGAAMKALASGWMDEELAMHREAVARFIETDMLPNDARWRAGAQCRARDLAQGR